VTDLVRQAPPFPHNIEHCCWLSNPLENLDRFTCRMPPAYFFLPLVLDGSRGFARCPFHPFPKNLETNNVRWQQVTYEEYLVYGVMMS
jgi:hypothetical protein